MQLRNIIGIMGIIGYCIVWGFWLSIDGFATWHLPIMILITIVTGVIYTKLRLKDEEKLNHPKGAANKN